MLPTKKQKLQDVRSFVPSWTIDYGFEKYGDKSRCGLCSEIIVSRTSSIKRHFESKHKDVAERNIDEKKELISQRLKMTENQSNLLSKFVKTNNNVTEASFKISHLIAKRSKPFSDGEYIKTIMLQAAPGLFQDFNNKEQIIQRIKELQLSRNTVKDRILKMSTNISEQLHNDINKCDYISICLDETTDIKSSCRLSIIARYPKENEMYEELLKLANIPERTRGTDICEIVINELKVLKIDVKKIISITTDGAPNMIGPELGFLNLFQKQVGHPIIGFHCIIHQQVLCAKNGTIDFKDISDKVNKIINFIVARDMHKRQFKKLLNDFDCHYDTLLMYNNVRWLSRAISLERFVDSLEEIRFFLQEFCKTDFKELYDTEWLTKLMFFTDITLHFNVLNTKLQGRGKTVEVMFGLIQGFGIKLDVFAREIKFKKLNNFPKLKTFLDESTIFKNNDWDFTEEFSKMLDLIKEQFTKRFKDFKTIGKLLKIINYPDLFDIQDFNNDFIIWMGLENLEMQTIDLQSNPIWTQKFVDMRKDIEKLEHRRMSQDREPESRIENLILEVWNSMPRTFSSVKKLAIGLLTIFSSTYSCESLFSLLNHVLSKTRNRLTEEDSEACIILQSTTYNPDITNLTSNMKQKTSNIF